MNESELREHLRTVLEPIAPPPPDVRDLRLTGRVRRRWQGAVGVFLVLLAVSVSVGFVVGHRSPARATIVVGGARVPLEAVDCAGGSVTLVPGQSVQVTGCPVGGRLASSDSGVVVPAGPSVFRAVAPGRATLSRSEGCTSSASCGGLGAITVTVLTVGPGGLSAPTVPPAGSGVDVDMDCSVNDATLVVGQRLVLIGCSPRTASHVVEGAVLRADGATTFLATGVGTATVTLSEPTTCQLSSTAVCPDLERVHTIAVTVAALAVKGSPVR